jgi:hypothetical protein
MNSVTPVQPAECSLAPRVQAIPDLSDSEPTRMDGFMQVSPW